jgi:hypothetical protein
MRCASVKAKAVSRSGKTIATDFPFRSPGLLPAVATDRVFQKTPGGRHAYLQLAFENLMLKIAAKCDSS